MTHLEPQDEIHGSMGKLDLGYWLVLVSIPYPPVKPEPWGEQKLFAFSFISPCGCWGKKLLFWGWILVYFIGRALFGVCMCFPLGSELQGHHEVQKDWVRWATTWHKDNERSWYHIETAYFMKQLQGTVKETVRPPSTQDLWLKTGRDQLDPTWQLISPNGNP